MSKPITLVVNSADRISSSASTADFTVRIATNPIQHKRARLLQASVPLSSYTIHSRNNRIYFTHSVDGVKIGTITPSYYTSATIAAAVKSAMDAVSTATYTVVYSAALGKITISPSSGTVSLTFGTNTANSAAIPLGWNNADIATAASQTSTNVLDLSGPGYLLLDIGGGEVQSSNNEVRMVSAVIPCNANGQEFTTFETNNDFDINMELRGANMLNVRLLRPDGTLYDTNGVDWFFILRLEM